MSLLIKISVTVTLLVTMTKYLPKAMGRRVYLGSHFRGSVRHGREGMTARHKAAGALASAVRKRRATDAMLSLLSPSHMD